MTRRRALVIATFKAPAADLWTWRAIAITAPPLTSMPSAVPLQRAPFVTAYIGKAWHCLLSLATPTLFCHHCSTCLRAWSCVAPLGTAVDPAREELPACLPTGGCRFIALQRSVLGFTTWAASRPGQLARATPACMAASLAGVASAVQCGPTDPAAGPLPCRACHTTCLCSALASMLCLERARWAGPTVTGL